MRPRLSIIGRIASLGISPFVMSITESIISMVMNGGLKQYGGDLYVGALTVMQSVMQFIGVPVSGFTQGVSPIISYNYGAKNVLRVKKTFRLLLIVCLSYSILVWTAVELFPAAFAGIFCSDAALLDFTAKALRIYMGGIGIFGIQIACQMAFVSIGNALCSIIVAVVRKFILLLPLIYIVPHFVADKAMGTYIAEPIADILAVIFTTILFAVTFRKAMNKLSSENEITPPK
jgi:Na+-driven multidrug efflux pump